MASCTFFLFFEKWPSECAAAIFVVVKVGRYRTVVAVEVWLEHW